MAEAISWEWAQRTAALTAGREPLADSYHAGSLDADFAQATELAQDLVEKETGLRSLAGEARSVVTDRAGWSKANVASFRRLLGPISERFAPKTTIPFIAPATRIAAGVELGGMLGWMSTRVLGQYDVLLVEDVDPQDQDVVYFVGPNILALERRYGFPPKEFRLWIALHELTHRAQFTGVPWMRGYFTSLVSQTLEGIDPDPKAMLNRLIGVAKELRQGENTLSQGLPALLATPQQRELLAKIQGLMSLLEGHGDVTMDRAAADLIPNASRFSSVLRERRASVQGPARLLQRLLGLEAKMRQYQEGEEFVAAVEARGGPSLLARVWDRQENLPTAPEILEPASWVNRILESGVAPVANSPVQ